MIPLLNPGDLLGQQNARTYLVHALCPGCRAWQVTIEGGVRFSELERAIGEHADECPDLAVIRAAYEAIG